MYSLNKLIEMSNGDEQFVQSIVSTFLTNVPLALSNISEGIEKTDFEKIRFYAHQLKSSIDFFAVESLQEIVRSMEKDAKGDNPNLKQHSEWYDSMEKTLSAIFHDLRESKWYVA
jgi:HPt (histidine-containing phosphotransfer) domain-containing protein